MKLSIKSDMLIRKILFDLLLVILFAICITNNSDPDYANYERQYNAYGTGQLESLLYKYEFLYASLGVLFYRLGFVYSQFRTAFFLIIFLIYRKVILDYSRTPVLILVCFCFFPYLLFCVQMRNAMGAIIVIYGIRYLMKTKKIDKIKYAVCVLVASLFHETCILYLVLLFVNHRYFYRLYKWFTIGLFLAVYTVLPTILSILYVITSNRRFWYYNTTVPMSVVLRHSMPVILIAIMIYYCINRLEKKSFKENYDVIIMGRISLVICSLILLIRININFSRLIYFMMPIFLITISNISKIRASRGIKNDVVILRGFCLFISIVYFVLLLSPLQETMYETVTRVILPWLN